MLKAYSNTNIDFRFKTLEANGLLFFNGGRRSDFIAVELVNGHIHYIFDLGDGPITLRDKSRVHMNDNRWHSVSIRRPGPKTHTLGNYFQLSTTEQGCNLLYNEKLIS